jgi:hypothetical protein
MRKISAGAAILGVLLAVVGVFLSAGWLILLGAAVLVVATVMRASVARLVPGNGDKDVA